MSQIDISSSELGDYLNFLKACSEDELEEISRYRGRNVFTRGLRVLARFPGWSRIYGATGRSARHIALETALVLETEAQAQLYEAILQGVPSNNWVTCMTLVSDRGRKSKMSLDEEAVRLVRRILRDDELMKKLGPSDVYHVLDSALSVQNEEQRVAFFVALSMTEGPDIVEALGDLRHVKGAMTLFRFLASKRFAIPAENPMREVADLWQQLNAEAADGLELETQVSAVAAAAMRSPLWRRALLESASEASLHEFPKLDKLRRAGSRSLRSYEVLRRIYGGGLGFPGEGMDLQQEVRGTNNPYRGNAPGGAIFEKNPGARAILRGNARLSIALCQFYLSETSGQE